MSDLATCCDPKVDELLLARSKVVYVSAALLVDEDGKILLSKRPEGKNLSGYWELPGGKVESEETPEAALVRELEEELGVKTCAGCLYPLTFVSYHYGDFHLVMNVYVCRNWKGSVMAQEGQEMCWIEPKAIMAYTMPPANDGLKTFIRDHV
jgi:8-oxo-dGTP diphosphatase